MKVYELAKVKGVNAKELAKELGLKSHLSEIPDGIVAEEPKTEVVVPVKVEAPVVEEVPSGVDDKAIRQSIIGLGTKSAYWYLRAKYGIR